MQKPHLMGLGVFAGAFSTLLGLPVMAQPQVEITTHPPLTQLVPFHEPVDFSLHLTDRMGKPLPPATVQVKVLAPAKTPWFTTDFPIVEGTTLLELPIATSNGRAEFQLMPPIRGHYTLQLESQPQQTEAFAPFSEKLTFRVPENPEKYYNLGILLGILLLLGGGSGWIMGGNTSAQDGDVAPQPVKLLLSGAMLAAIAVLLYVAVTAEMAEAHTQHPSANDSRQIASQAHKDLTVTLEDGAVAIVGQAIPMTLSVKDAITQKPVNEVQLTVTTQQLELNKPVLKFQTTPNQAGQLTWRQQFFDGSTHRVSVQVAPRLGATRQFVPFEVSKDIDVEGVAPPLSVRLIALGYFTSVYVIGMFVGFGLRQSIKKSPAAS
jgi:hypothetical protein